LGELGSSSFLFFSFLFFGHFSFFVVPKRLQNPFENCSDSETASKRPLNTPQKRKLMNPEFENSRKRGREKEGELHKSAKVNREVEKPIETRPIGIKLSSCQVFIS